MRAGHAGQRLAVIIEAGPGGILVQLQNLLQKVIGDLVRSGETVIIESLQLPQSLFVLLIVTVVIVSGQVSEGGICVTDAIGGRIGQLVVLCQAVTCYVIYKNVTGELPEILAGSSRIGLSACGSACAAIHKEQADQCRGRGSGEFSFHRIDPHRQ